MSIMNGIRKAMESADSGLQELIDEVVTHADELEEDASERMYAGMYGEDDSADISSADIDDDDDYEVPVTQSDADPETNEEDEPMLLKQRNELESEDALESLLKALEGSCCESDSKDDDKNCDDGKCDDSDDDDFDDDNDEDDDSYEDDDDKDESAEESLLSLLNSL